MWCTVISKAKLHCGFPKLHFFGFSPTVWYTVSNWRLFEFQVLKGLATKEKRPRSLLKALTFHLTRRKDLEDLKLASDALYSCAKLSIKEPELMEILCINASKALVEYTVSQKSFFKVQFFGKSHLIASSKSKMNGFYILFSKGKQNSKTLISALR